MSNHGAAAQGSCKKNFETILAGRKCYRMSKEKNEVVWPPHLEQALMEGLDKYTPAESKSPRGLTRFPNRNKFIAEYILKKTGEIRTAKQVGSRIQQLRDTSAGKTIMKAISDRHYEMMHPSRPSEPAYDMGMSDIYFNGAVVSPMNQIIHVYISVPLIPSTWSAQASRPTEVSVLSNSFYSWAEPRPLRTIDPTVTFTSQTHMTLYSSFTVYCGSTVMHIDQPKPMRSRSSDEFGSSPGSYMHCTTLAPGYWDNLCACADLSPYTIVQEITKQPTDLAQKHVAAMMIQYHFNTASAPPLSPFALNEDDLEIDYEADEMTLPHALSTSSESPYAPSDRSSSPSYSIPPAGFCSQPLSPVDWTQPVWALPAPVQQLPMPVLTSSSSSSASPMQLPMPIMSSCSSSSPMQLPMPVLSSSSSSMQAPQHPASGSYVGAYGMHQHQHQHQHQHPQQSRAYLGAHSSF